MRALATLAWGEQHRGGSTRGFVQWTFYWSDLLVSVIKYFQISLININIHFISVVPNLYIVFCDILHLKISKVFGK